MIVNVFEGLKLVAEGIENIKDIVDAVKSGRDYLKLKHPELRSDLRALILELRKNVNLIKQASSVLTNFRFAITEDAMGEELARFNRYFIDSKAQTDNIRAHIDDLRSRCSKIRDHGKRIAGQATAAGFAKFFNLLGLGDTEREVQLGIQLDKLSYQDFDAANAAELMVECLELALWEVQDTLGSNGLMLPEGVPAAAALLAQYGRAFEEMEEGATVISKEIRLLAEDLTS